jgi:hypothetical protein
VRNKSRQFLKQLKLRLVEGKHTLFQSHKQQSNARTQHHNRKQTHDLQRVAAAWKFVRRGRWFCSFPRCWCRRSTRGGGDGQFRCRRIAIRAERLDLIISGGRVGEDGELSSQVFIRIGLCAAQIRPKLQSPLIIVPMDVR